MVKLRSLSFLVVILFPLFVTAQKADNPETEKQQRLALLVDQIVSDAQNLRLGENRAVVYARAGNAIWKSDQKRGAALFQNAIEELTNAQAAAESDRKNTAYQQDLLNGQQTRPHVLQTIAARDAEFALQSFYRTRPSAIERALTGAVNNMGKIVGSGPNDSYLAQKELALEQQLLRLAAEKYPERAIALLKEAIKKDLSVETLELLKKLFEKDADEANRLASDVVGRLLRKQFAANNQADSQIAQSMLSILVGFVSEPGKTGPALKFDESQMKELADKLISFTLDPVSRNVVYLSPQLLLKVAEKLAPSKVEPLKKIQNQGSQPGGQSDPAVSALLAGNSTPDQLLAGAKTVPAAARGQIYQTAANRLSQAGEIVRATEILRENFSGSALDNAISSLNWYYAHDLLNHGKYKEAEAVMDDFIENNRQAAFIGLAQAVFKKDPDKNKSYAVSLLAKALGPVVEKPENSNEMNRLMRVISVYATIDPDEGCRLFESVVPQLNEVINASAVLFGFQGASNIKQGEFILIGGNPSWANVDLSVLRTLAEKNFEDTLNLINEFTRREMRIAVKQQLADGLAQPPAPKK